MSFTRGIRAHVAGWLFALVLLNGLACSFGHGQMMAAPGAAMGHAMSAQHSGHDMAGMHGKASLPASMKTPFDACFFAGSLPLSLFLCAALGWLLRSGHRRPPQVQRAISPTPRHGLPALNPRAP